MITETTEVEVVEVEKCSITKGHSGEEYPTSNTTKKANFIGHILRSNCLLKRVIEGKIEGRIEVNGRRGRRCKQLLEDLKDRKQYWKLKEEARDSTEWRTALEDITSMHLSWEDRLENGQSQSVTLKS